jgi:maleylpyruvate isomerase
MAAPAAWLELMRQGEAFVLAEVAALDDTAFAAPSALPGWSRAHVVAHLARNADALCNLFDWARTGIETPMYPSVEARARGIEESATQTPDALRSDLTDASARFVAAADGLPEGAWDAPVRTASNRAITATEVPWMRVRETWVHAVDLDAGRAFEELPVSAIDGLIEEVAGGLARRDDCPPVVVRCDDGRTWRLGTAPAGAAEVEGSAPAILAWLLGRTPPPSLRAVSAGAGGGLPDLPPWL